MAGEDTQARALLIQNRLSDPKGLGLSQSPAFYFDHRRRTKDANRQVLQEKTHFEPNQTTDFDDFGELGKQKIAILKEILDRKRAKRQTIDSANAQISSQIHEKQSLLQYLLETESALSRNYYEKTLSRKQTRAETEEAVKRLERNVSTQEAACIDATRMADFLQNAYLESISECACIETQCFDVKSTLETLETKLTDLHDIESAYTDTISDLQLQSITNRQLLKSLNNRLQELKGNIRVFCRLRPLLPEDHSPPANIQFLGGNRIKIAGSDGKDKVFRFDRVFDQNSTQEMIFEDISQLVQSAVDGYKVSIFAYGQTGSGKTYTMEGPADCSDESTKGVIQRSVEQIFSTAEELRRLGWVYRLRAAVTEVYNEQVRDLLEGSKVMTAFSTNLLEPTVVEVQRPEQLYDLLAKARQQRAVAQTLCNTHSSRSHSLFRLSIDGTNLQDSKSTKGVLHLVDLAGSEKLDDSGEDGRKAETIAINASLSALGDVINAMARKSAHIPFRNSKLTAILKDCLGADSKTLMFLNINPSSSRLPETLRSLKFGSKVSQCNLLQQRAK